MNQDDRTRSAVDVFPVEVWELVLEKVDNTRDIQNVIKAFPELQGLFKENRCSWLIGDLMPLIMSKFLTVRDIISCRLVSKRWKNSVGTSLEAHPDRLPYKANQLTQISEQHFSYSRVPRISTNLGKLISLCGNTARDPVSENPFPGRHVIVEVGIDHPKIFTKALANLDETLPVLRDFGHHVWYLTVDFFVKDVTEEFFIKTGLTPLFECLSFLPNLRSLKIIRRGLTLKQPREYKMSAEIPIAAFPFQLKTLDLAGFSADEDVYGRIINAFGSFDGIQQLKLSTENWKENYTVYFPNLTDVRIYIREQKELYTFLRQLRNPHLLQKLKIGVTSLKICKLLKILSNSPWQVVSLEIEAETIRESQFSSNTLCTTIKDLKITVGSGLEDLSFEFLTALPELKYLTVCDYGWRDPYWNVQFKTFTGESIFRFLVEGRKDWNNFEDIWEELPELEMLTVFDGDGFTYDIYQYTRECEGNVFKSYVDCRV